MTSDTHYSGEREYEHHAFWAGVASENPDVISHAGDWISHDQKCLKKTFKMMDEYLPGIPKVTTFGNHDLWQQWSGRQNQKAFEKMQNDHDELCAKYNIIHLNSTCHVISHLVFAGIDGWYSTARPNTRDHKFLPQQIDGLPIHLHLMKKAGTDFDSILLQIQDKQYDNKTKIFVSHFPTYTPGYKDDGFIAPEGWHKFIIENFQIAHYGHTHNRVVNEMHGGCSINNSGSYYHFDETLKYITMDV